MQASRMGRPSFRSETVTFDLPPVTGCKAVDVWRKEAAGVIACARIPLIRGRVRVTISVAASETVSALGNINAPILAALIERGVIEDTAVLPRVEIECLRNVPKGRVVVSVRQLSPPEVCERISRGRRVRARGAPAQATAA